MKIIVSENGIDVLLFSMTSDEVISKWGEPDNVFVNENDNTVYTYNEKQTHLTFVDDGGTMRFFKYECLSPMVELHGRLLWDVTMNEFKSFLREDNTIIISEESHGIIDTLFFDGFWIDFKYGVFRSIVHCLSEATYE